VLLRQKKERKKERKRIPLYFLWNIIINLSLTLKIKHNANNLFSWCFVITVESRHCFNNHQWRIKQRDILLSLYKTFGYYFSTRSRLPDLKHSLTLADQLHRLVTPALKWVTYSATVMCGHPETWFMDLSSYSRLYSPKKGVG